MADGRSRIETCGLFAAQLKWGDLSAEARQRTVLLLLDTLGCAVAAFERRVHRAWVDRLVAGRGAADASVWTEGTRLPAMHAALVNGSVTHHLELDDGHPLASVHGGTTIIPAALACAEVVECTGAEFLTSVAAGYAVAVACGGPLLPGIVRHRIHPSGVNGGFGAAAAAARLLHGDADRITSAVGIAGLLAPIAPFESFTQGAPVKDLYAGWPAYVGIRAATFAGAGLGAPRQLFEAPTDGISSFLNHEPLDADAKPDAETVLEAQFKPYATCRSVQPTLTAVERLGVLEPDMIEWIDVSTYPFAVELSEECDASTAIGARASIPYCVASRVLDGGVGPDAFTSERLRQPERRAMALRVRVSLDQGMVAPLVRGSRVTVTMRDGAVRSASVDETEWGQMAPATESDLLAKFRAMTGGRASALERAVFDLPDADRVSPVIDAMAGLGVSST